MNELEIKTSSRIRMYLSLWYVKKDDFPQITEYKESWKKYKYKRWVSLDSFNKWKLWKLRPKLASIIGDSKTSSHCKIEEILDFIEEEIRKESELGEEYE